MIKITKSQNLKAKPEESKLGFGKHFTDHMLLINYNPKQGWHDARIEPFENFSLSPAAMVFHYGQAIFDGLKAFLNDMGEAVMFRPQANLKRMRASASRMCMPKIDEQLTLKGLNELIKLEKDWIPKSDEAALYIRPTMIATDPFLGVRPSENYLFYIILSPVGAYYANGFAPVGLYVEDFYSRAAEGGTGAAKFAGNYASSLIASSKAKEMGLDQVLWLDAKDKRYVEEVGAMNMFFVQNGEVITAGLDGTILPGITRDSIITWLKSKSITVRERKIAIDEIIDGIKAGTITEAFGTGTAAVVSPVAKINFKDKDYKISDTVGTITQMLYDTLTKIQRGKIEDTFSWVYTVK